MNPTPITGQQPYDIYYYLVHPQVYRINGNANNDYFLVENRRFNQTMTIGTTTVPDYNNSAFFPPSWPHGTITQGIFVWRVIGGYPTDYNDNGLVYASGRYGRTYPENTLSETDDGVPFPGVAGIKVLSPWSDNRNPYSTSYDPDLGTFNNIFIPNTKSSTNVGMEIIFENSSQGYFSIMLYQSNPQDASPAKPQDLAFTTNNQVTTTWTNNNEPDRQHWEVWRKYYRTQFDQQDWTLVATRTTPSYTDPDFQLNSPGDLYTVYYKVRTKDTQGSYSIFSDIISTSATRVYWKIGEVAQNNLPDKFSIKQNYPNPFNPSTTIDYSVPEASNVTIAIYDHLGREVASVVNKNHNAGFYSATFDAGKLSSGVYFYTIKAGSYAATKKMILMK